MFLPEIFEISDLLLFDKEDLVHKGCRVAAQGGEQDPHEGGLRIRDGTEKGDAADGTQVRHREDAGSMEEAGHGAMRSHGWGEEINGCEG